VWTFVLSDRAGNALGELRNATGRSLRFPLNRTPTFSFTVQTDNPFSSLFLTDDKVLVKAYDDSSGTKVLRFYGPVVGHDKARNSQGGTISVTAAGAQWRLDRRLIGKSNTGATFGTTALSLLDRGEIMGRIVDAVNTTEATNIFTTGGDTGIRRGTITASSQTYVSDWRYKVAGEAMADLSGTLDGPDWMVRPVEPAADAVGLQIGALDVSPAFGSVNDNVVWAFGTPPYNVAEWHDTGDSTSLANLAISLPPGFPDNATAAPITSSDPAGITDRGLLEAVVAADLQTDSLRTTLVQEHVRVRQIPRRVIAITPVAEDASGPIERRRVPRLFADYIVGDVVRFRAMEHFSVETALQIQASSGGLLPAGTLLPSGSLLPGGVLNTETASIVTYVQIPTVDLLMRVYVAQVDLDDAGVQTTSVALQMET
jgi:hypothetical protein